MKIAILGCGNLGSALVRGLVHAKTFQHKIVVCDRNQNKIDAATSPSLGKDIKSTMVPQEAVVGADVVVTVVRPQHTLEMLKMVAPNLSSGSLVISCAAGLSTQTLSQVLSQGVSVARAMPNTAIQVGRGATALCYGKNCDSSRDKNRAEAIFGCVGEIMSIDDEESMHLVTVLLGSAPAFYLYFLEAMALAGVAMGLSKAAANKLSRASLLSAAALMSGSNADSELLRKQIAHKKGVTEQGIVALEEGGFLALVEESVRRATKRSTNMASEIIDG